MRGLVHCDTCHYEFHSDNVADFHKKACEKCGAAPLISDADLAVVQFTDGLIEAGLMTQEKRPGTINVRIDTSGLRAKP